MYIYTAIHVYVQSVARPCGSNDRKNGKTPFAPIVKGVKESDRRLKFASGKKPTPTTTMTTLAECTPSFLPTSRPPSRPSNEGGIPRDKASRLPFAFPPDETTDFKRRLFTLSMGDNGGNRVFVFPLDVLCYTARAPARDLCSKYFAQSRRLP